MAGKDYVSDKGKNIEIVVALLRVHFCVTFCIYGGRHIGVTKQCHY
jgi:hypothetical protein